MKKLIEESSILENGYHQMVNFEQWRVAILNWAEDIIPQRIKTFQKHKETDEVFVLLDGDCVLYGLAEDEEIFGIKMQPKKIYNVKKGTYHSHVLSKNAMVLIVENDNTASENSPTIMLNEKQRENLVKIADDLLGNTI